VLALLDPADKTFVQSGDRHFSELQHEIEMRAVSFCYRTKATPAIKDISLHIPKGKLTALVGPSGAGKSTIVNLICRFYDVTAGEILVDGTPLNAFESGSWRSRIAVVSQDPFLFAATIADNIAYSRPGATRAEIQDAARRAHAHEFICELPQGYETLVGDRGVRLSGGQRQRIAIARAFLCNAELLILDEATNELDGLSEALIQEVIRSLRGQCTVLAIAHRLSTIEEADHIVVLDKGSVVEDGQLVELIEKNGLFARLYRSQRSVRTDNRQLEAG
jgi:subfamily B ATP-binding cassette protein MsbA